MTAGSRYRWPTRRLKFVANLTAGQSAEGAAVNDSGDGLPFLQGCAEFGSKTPSANRFCIDPPKLAPGGSWLVSVRAPVGRTNMADQVYGIGRGLAAVEAVGVDGDFLGYVLEDSAAALNSLATGSTFLAVSAPQLGSLEVPIPPLETQKRIVELLNGKTAQLDALIARKQALLERLVEKRQALVTRAVTKGLHPAAPMKDSGIDWLGQIPAHWDVWPLKRMIATSTYGISASLEPTGEVAILRMGNLQNGELDFTELRYLDEIDESLLLKDRDVVFNRTNSLDLVGKGALYRGNHAGKLSFASYLVRFRFDDRYDPEFAVYVMGTDVLMALGRTLALPSIGQANLNPNRYAEIHFPVPPMNEQAEIAAHLAARLTDLSHAETQVNTSIAKLTEYRAGLITSAITGQIEGLQ